MARWVLFLSRAPKYREMTTPPPTPMPLKKPMMRKVRLPPLLTAAKALFSAKLPMTQASAML